MSDPRIDLIIDSCRSRDIDDLSADHCRLVVMLRRFGTRDGRVWLGPAPYGLGAVVPRGIGYWRQEEDLRPRSAELFLSWTDVFEIVDLGRQNLTEDDGLGVALEQAKTDRRRELTKQELLRSEFTADPGFEAWFLDRRTVLEREIEALQREVIDFGLQEFDDLP